MWPSSQSPPPPSQQQPPGPPGPPPAAHAHSNLNPLRNEQELPPPSYYSSVIQPGGGGNSNSSQQDHQQQHQPPQQGKELEVHPPRIGDRAPSLGPTVTFPTEKPLLVVFLRVCGCPFAAQTFTNLTTFSTHHPSITCLTITQSPAPETDEWIISLGGLWSISSVLPDPSLSLYHAWGLGQNRSWYDWFVENLKVPVTTPTNVTSLDHRGHGKYQGGSKWQQGAAFGVDKSGTVRWVWVGRQVDEIPDFEKGGVVEALVGRRGGRSKKGEGRGVKKEGEGGDEGQQLK
ncbi:hypothetical protein B0T21DRAFT_286512 [Apiosordaria backusii]|uniref:Uncharacterized protein n=1 Tax=Apiosordaria backusii TaxID=314023 RepID=A0AA40BMG7_9PEZI|nr:hypothetical protein B0T21DRAFT_286512 [Apiosordaria backusii]